MIAGRYELEREVGRGGMGAVWLAEDTVLGRRVAVKKVGVAPGGSSPDLERAEREARLAARLSHAHSVAVFDLVTDDDGQWLVMEYVEGTTLAGLVKEEGALEPERATRLLQQAADALAAAHAAGIVHRDVKPSNMLVDEHGHVKLSDFGIAKAESDATLTQTGLVTGSPAYLAPEVASGRAATDASDVWSLGASLFHALAGRPPYQVGDNLMGTLYQIVHEEPPRLPDAGWLAPLLESTMTHDPADRWSMAQVRDYLAAGPAASRALPVPEPVPGATPAATPLPEATQALQAVQPAPAPTRPSRTPLLLAAAGVVLLLVLVGVAWSLVTGGDDPTTTTSPGGGGDSPAANESSDSARPDEQPTAEGMETFIGDYLTTAAADPSRSFPMLTESFQADSGGFEGYSGFWNTIESARLVDVSADPEALTVAYTVDYVKTDGSEISSDVVLGLVFRNGRYLIDEEG